MHVLVLAASAYLEKEDAEWRIGLEVGMFTYIPLFEMTGIATLFFGCMNDSKTFWFPIQLSSSIDPGATLTSLTTTTISVISTPAFR